MPPRQQEVSNEFIEPDEKLSTQKNEKWQLVWPTVITLATVHTWGLYGLYIFLFKAKWLTVFFVYILHYCSGLGITAGAHRLWSHKSFKARLPLKIMLMIFNTMAIQWSVINWVRDHRMHHKYSDTDADPHNIKRGFVFAHGGWLMLRKHPELIAKAHTIDYSDATSDPVLRFQKRYYGILVLTCFLIPSYIPTFWGETFFNGLATCGFYRLMRIWHATNCINSLAHMWGDKPYNKNINPVQNRFVSLFMLGEGHHNFHHSFPVDYRAAEFSGILFNITSVFIELMEKIGWAYDLKTVSPDVVRKYVERTGDGSHGVWGHDETDTNGVPDTINK